MRSQFFQVAVLTVVGSCSRPAPRSGPPALAVPAEQRYDPPGGERRPLLVVLHGLGSSGKQMFDAIVGHFRSEGATTVRTLVDGKDTSVVGFLKKLGFASSPLEALEISLTQ